MSPRGSAPGGTAPEIPPYASTRLIAYIGNKRALLPFLRSVFLELDALAPVSSFLDPFAGSGAASRLARSLGWRVMANDAEDYSWTVNACWLGVGLEEAATSFGPEGGLGAVLARLNRLHPQREDEPFPADPYIARHYAPADTFAADWRRERLFFTRENAVFLDRARAAIENLRPATPAGRAAWAERALLLGPLVYEAATHANTSGVFKAYHKGFGGHGRDALGRILAPMELEAPLLWEGQPAELGKGDAAAFCAGRPAELCYLDPPYNQHQYGSNYHLLNTLARWDRQPIPEERGEDGRLLHKAGIPRDWRRSRSAFCSRVGARAAFRGLLASVDARFIVLSYNSEGLVPPGELYDLLSEGAEVELRSVDYLRYRGGRQSAGRRAANREILFVARRREAPGRPLGSAAESGADSGSGKSRRDLSLERLEADVRLAKALEGPFEPASLARFAGEGRDIAVLRLPGSTVELPTFRFLVLESAAREICSALPSRDKMTAALLLEGARAGDLAAACDAAARLVEGGAVDARLQSLAISWLRKLAHAKYAQSFRSCAERLAAAARSRPGELGRLAAGLAEIEDIFTARVQSR